MTKTVYVKLRLTLEGDIISDNDVTDVINNVSYDFGYDNGLVRVIESDDLEVIMVDLTANEMWKILDAITAYKKDYAVSVPVQKIIKDIEKKLKVELKK